MAPGIPRLRVAALVVLAACLLPWRVAAQDSAFAAEAALAGWRQVITRAEIERSGIMRLGELARLARRWDAVTVDEYTWRAAPAGLAALEQDDWAVVLDGHEVDPSLLGVLALERLPVDLGAVDSAVFTAAPALAAGSIRGRGLLEIHTWRPAAGFAARTRYATGSETGDPGPFAFLPGSVPNRDRFGHDAAIGAGYGGPRWYLSAALGLGVHVPTDPAIADRLAATGMVPRIERTAPSLRLGFSTAHGRHDLSAGRARLDDWVRFEAYAAEIPARSTLEHAGVMGTHRLGGAELGYRAGYEHADLQSVVATLLHVESRVARGELVVARSGSKSPRRAGIGFVRRSTNGPGGLPDPVTLELRGFAELEWSPGAHHRQHLAVSAGTVDGEPWGGASLTHRWRAGAGDQVALLLSLDQPAPSGTGLWSLAARGDDWLGDAGVISSIDSGAPRARQAGADAAWVHRAGRHVTVSAGLYYRAFRSGFLTRRELAFDPDRLAWRGPVAVSSGRPGQVGGLSGGAEVSLGPGARVAGWYRMRAVLSGGSDVRDAWSVLPDHAGGIEAYYLPADGFELSSRVALRGTIDRAEYRGTGALAAAGGRTGASLTLDLGVQKWFWAKRLRAHLAARNILDARDVTHPEGGGTGRAFVLLAEAMVR